MPRQKLKINSEEVEKLALLGATNCDIADFFNCDEGTIRKRFSEVLTKARSNMRLRLRQIQWKAAEKGNVTMMIWLGKQMLGQTDKIENKNETTTTVKDERIVYTTRWGAKDEDSTQKKPEED